MVKIWSKKKLDIVTWLEPQVTINNTLLDIVGGFLLLLDQFSASRGYYLNTIDKNTSLV